MLQHHEVRVFALAMVFCAALAGWAAPAAAQDAPETGSCVPSRVVLCLYGDRFEISMVGVTSDGERIRASAAEQTADTGLFYYFLPSTLEVAVKIVDGRPLNDRFWIFFASLTNLEFTLRVTDTVTGETRRYFNPQGVFASVGDTSAFPLDPAEGGLRWTAPAATAVPEAAASGVENAAEVAFVPAADAPGDELGTYPCPDDGRTLCLWDGRFHVRASWQDFQGGTGVGRSKYITPRPSLDESGFFWFFHPDNLELGVKILDGREINGSFWFFYGALSNVAYQIELEDTVTGFRQIYNNPSGTFGSLGDTSALSGQQCQGIAGLQCPETEACSLPADMCNVADLAGICVSRPACLAIPRQVCGCDGKTYLNDCYLLEAEVAKDHDGPCE